MCECPLYILRVTDYDFQINIIFISLMIDLVLVNSADPDEKLHYASDLHCLQKSSKDK